MLKVFKKLKQKMYSIVTAFFVFNQTVLQALSIINRFSPNPRDCKLTLGNDQLRYYHTFFGVHRESPYQVQLRQE